MKLLSCSAAMDLRLAVWDGQGVLHWQRTCPGHRIPDSGAHLWQASPPEDDAVTREIENTLLSKQELTRASTFRLPEKRRSYIVSRGLLRSVLSEYLMEPPAGIQFTYGPHGRPRLSRPPGADPVEFSLSRTEGVILIAVSRCAVGVDVERITRDIDAMAIARRFFSPQEAEALAALPPTARRKAFFRLWTCKEAILKAQGIGLAGLEDLAVLPRQSSARWSCCEFEPAPQCAAALAILRSA